MEDGRRKDEKVWNYLNSDRQNIRETDTTRYCALQLDFTNFLN